MTMIDFIDFLIAASHFRRLLILDNVVSEKYNMKNLIDNMDSIIEDVCTILGLQYADKCEEISIKIREMDKEDDRE